jgi:hypothetical protein
MKRTSSLAPLAVLAALGLAGCRSEKPAAATAPAHEAPAIAEAGGSAYVIAVSALRREPAETSRVPGPGGKDVSNVLATLHRGEKVTVVDAAARVVDKEEWAHVRSSDDRDGWLKRTALLEGHGVTEATVLVPADVFDRPDLLAANARRKIEPGTLLLVVRERPPFSEVNTSSGPNAWVLSDRLAIGEAEVSVAKLAEKGRWLRRIGKPDDALRLVALARSRFAGVALVEQVAIELGEQPPAAAVQGGEIVPASGVLPAQEERRPDETP